MKYILLIFSLIASSATNIKSDDILCYRSFYFFDLDFTKYEYTQRIVFNDSSAIYSTVKSNKLMIFNLENFQLLKEVEDTLGYVDNYTIKSLNEFVLQSEYGFLVFNKNKIKYFSKSDLPKGIAIASRFDFEYDFEREVFIVRVFNYNKIDSEGSAFDGLAIWDGNSQYKELSIVLEDYFLYKYRLFDDEYFIKIFDDEYLISNSCSNRYFIIDANNPENVKMNNPDFKFDVEGFESTASTNAMEQLSIRRHNYDFKHKFGPLVKIKIESNYYYIRIYYFHTEEDLYLATLTPRQDFEIQIFDMNNKFVKKIYESGVIYGHRSQLVSHKNAIGFSEKLKFQNKGVNKEFRILRMYNFIINHN